MLLSHTSPLQRDMVDIPSLTVNITPARGEPRDLVLPRITRKSRQPHLTLLAYLNLGATKVATPNKAFMSQVF